MHSLYKGTSVFTYISGASEHNKLSTIYATYYVSSTLCFLASHENSIKIIINTFCINFSIFSNDAINNIRNILQNEFRRNCRRNFFNEGLVS